MPSKIKLDLRGEEAGKLLLGFLDLPLEDPEYKETPRRVEQWFQEFIEDPDLDFHLKDTLSKTFGSPHAELVFETGLSFVSLCPHHLLPYWGTGSIGYIPNNKVVGISKLARALELVSHRAIKQEDVTSELADAIMTHLDPRGCMVVLKAFHSCMGLRGIKQPNHLTGTSAIRGCFAKDQDSCRTEFLRLANP